MSLPAVAELHEETLQAGVQGPETAQPTCGRQCLGGGRAVHLAHSP